MMKIKIAGFNNDIEFDDYHINILEIVNAKYFKSFVTKLNSLINYQEKDERIIIIENEDIIAFEKNAMLIFDIFNMDFNDKKIITNLYNMISNNIKLDSIIDEEYKEINKKIYNYIKHKLNDTEFEYTLKEEVKFEDVLKLFNVKIDNEYYLNLDEKLCFLFDLVSTFNLTKIIILVNIKFYFEDDELEEIYKYAKAKQINLLLVEANSRDTILKYEKKILIDQEYDDFLIQ